MPSYEYQGGHRVMVVPLSRWVEPGETVTTEQPINHPHFVLVKPRKAEKPDPKEATDADN